MDSKRSIVTARGRRSKVLIVMISTVASLGVIVASAAPPSRSGSDAEINRHAQAMIDEGRKIFRYDTFGSEAFWGDTLQLHKAIAGEKNGGWSVDLPQFGQLSIAQIEFMLKPPPCLIAQLVVKVTRIDRVALGFNQSVLDFTVKAPSPCEGHFRPLHEASTS